MERDVTDLRQTVDRVCIDEYDRRRRYRLNVAIVANREGASMAVELLVGAARRPCLALVAGVHGDEHDGILALHQVIKELDPDHLQGTLLIIPVANPFACAAGQRRTPEDDADLNRVFPGMADGSLTERLAELLCQSVLRQADAVFSLHGAGTHGVLSPWIEFLDSPEPVGRASYEMARTSGFADLIALPKLPGRLLAAMGDLGVPLVEGEVGGRGTSTPSNVLFYKQRIYAVARHVGVLRRAGGTRQDGASIRVWHLGPRVTAEADGFFLGEVVLRQAVRKGDRLGTIVGLRGDVATVVRAPQDGVIGGYREHVGVQRGQVLVNLWTAA